MRLNKILLLDLNHLFLDERTDYGLGASLFHFVLY